MPTSLLAIIPFLFIPPSMYIFPFIFLPTPETVKTTYSYSTTTTQYRPENKPKKTVMAEKCNYFTKGLLEETNSPKTSKESCWWLDSGGIFYVEKGIGKTLAGNLDPNSFWSTKYKENNPKDTNDGLRPQNIFRLLNKKKWGDVSQEILFRINKYDLSRSENRNESNGVLLMSRYIDGNNLYYAGLRVDGIAVIKKKSNGVYITLATTTHSKSGKYDPINNPTLLIPNKWLGEKFVTQNNQDGSVSLKLFVNMGDSEEWNLILEATDTLKLSGSLPLTNPGNIGIRSDFMDLELSNFIVKPN